MISSHFVSVTKKLSSRLAVVIRGNIIRGKASAVDKPIIIRGKASTVDKPEVVAEKCEEWVVKALIEQAPVINKIYNLQFVSLIGNEMICRLPANKAIVGSPITNIYHGSVNGFILDHTMGICAWSTIASTSRVSTISLSIDYFLPAPCEDLLCKAVIQHIGNKVIFTTGTIYKEKDPNFIVSTGRATWHIATGLADIAPLMKAAGMKR